MEQFRSILPRLYELKDCVKDPNSPDAYFQNFDEKLAIPHVRDSYLRSEWVLRELDSAAWEDLKKEAIPYLEKRNKKRSGWEQLFAILNQARAYRHLKAIGCTNLRFIPRSNKQKTPDIEGEFGMDRVVCEVKTINPSNGEIAALNGPPIARSLPMELAPEFLMKVRATIEQAGQQLSAYDRDGRAIHFAYLNISFDDFFAECKGQYFQLIDACLADAPVPGIRLVICNDYTAFYRPIQMLNATVDNIG